MRLNARQLINDIRRELEDETGAQGSYFSDPFLLQCIRRVHTKMVNKAIDGAEDFFAKIVDVDIAAGQQIFPLLDDFLHLRLLEFVSNPGAEPRQLIESRKVEGLFGLGAGGVGFSDMAYAVFGDEIQVDPKFGQAVTGGLRTYYIAEPPPPLLGTPVASTDTTITLDSEAPREDDILNGTFIDITEGLGNGDHRKITDYDGATKIATVGSDWSNNPDGTSEYATVPRVPRLFHDLLIVGAIVRAKMAREEYAAAYADEENDTFEEYESFIEQRTMSQRTVLPFDPYDGLG